MSQDEEVMCVSPLDVRLWHKRVGFTQTGSRILSEVLDGIPKSFVPRSLCEHDKSLKQILPYIILRDGMGRVLCYERPGSGGESRLHGKLSIGFGGHINERDGSYNVGFCREWREELAGDPSENLGLMATRTAVGTVNDDSTDVGSVHLGIVHVVETFEHMEIEPLEVRTWAWVYPAWLTGHPRLESWSQLILDWMVKE